LREHTNTSFSARVNELYEATKARIHETDLKAILESRPELMEAWQAYVEDQRTTDGWYVNAQNVPGRNPQWIVTRRGNAGAVSLDSPVSAFAALIARVVGEPLCVPGSGSETHIVP
jgi:hypothetical protein